MDYSKYICSGKEKLQCLLVVTALSGVLAWLFYRSCRGMVLFPIVYHFYKKAYIEKKIRWQKRRLLLEFKDALQALLAALLAGYSMENAWLDVEHVMHKMHGDNSLMFAEMKKINAAVKMNQPVEHVLEEFAKRSTCEEIESFAEIFSFAKRSGGDFVKIIRVTIQKIIGRMEVEQEIDTVLAGKKLEGNVMNLMPVLILAYMSVSAGDFLDVLYGNIMGAIVMSGLLIGYVIAIQISNRILDIKI